MKRNGMRKNLYRSIQRSLARYVAIMAIIALGAGLFVGLLATKTDMVATGQDYLDAQNMFDLRLVNTYGWTDRELTQIRKMDGVSDAEGVFYLDAIGTMGGGDRENVYQLYAIPERIDMPYLLGGRMPEAPNECLADGNFATDAVLGTTFTVSQSNGEDTLEKLTTCEFTVVGYVSTPLFLDMTRGNTTLGNGSIAAYVYLPREAFDVDYYTEIHVTIPGQYAIYSQRFNDAMEQSAEQLEAPVEPLAHQRYEKVFRDATSEYEKGLAEFEDGLSEYLDGKLEAEKELSDAYQKLSDGEKEIEENEKLLIDAQRQIESGKLSLETNQQELINAQKTLEQTRVETDSQLAEAEKTLDENRDMLNDKLAEVNTGLLQIEAGLAQLNLGIMQVETAIGYLDTSIAFQQSRISSLDSLISEGEAAIAGAQESGIVPDGIIVQMEQRVQELRDSRLEAQNAIAGLQNDRKPYEQQLKELEQQQQQVMEQRAQVLDAQKQIREGLAAVDAGFEELEKNREIAEKEFASAQSQIDEGEVQLAQAKALLRQKEQELADGKIALEEAKTELENGWKEYYDGEAQVKQEFSRAERELSDARRKLEDAKAQLDSMGEPEVYILDRNSNVGYLALDSNSDIVAGVSRVFPAFFLLVAALVCITTMTRMVEDERTQIGTLKALGYSNGAIISKYLIYAGSAAVLGCGVGVFVGCIVFPNILWTGYSLILTLRPQISIVFDIPLCVGVTLVYTLVICLVTWNCCRISLREVPAELIRPKPPTSGKKILLERLPFWDRISFLNKVMLRNIFRYRQRLLMMLVGIGGCTALLLTGFGIGDSIMDIVAIQYEEVTLYDMQVQFGSGRTDEQMQTFREELGGDASNILFAHQSGVDIDFDQQTKSVYMISSEGDMTAFFDFHNGSSQLTMPGPGEAMLSAGTAEAMGVCPGESITVRNSDMQEVELTVSGVFDNYVYNYVIIAPETIKNAWGMEPEYQMAYINAAPGTDPHILGATVSKADHVMNVLICQDLADQVGSMLQAMNLIVATVVVCASLLAVIVIYNLTNINITERLREIATIKVLGFTSVESALYVFKENLILSVMGTALGLLGGKFLLDFVMSQIKIDMVWFQPRILPASLAWSVVITILMAVLVDFVLYFKLEKINMAEALKPVE